MSLLFSGTTFWNLFVIPCDVVHPPSPTPHTHNPSLVSGHRAEAGAETRSPLALPHQLPVCSPGPSTHTVKLGGLGCQTLSFPILISPHHHARKSSNFFVRESYFPICGCCLSSGSSSLFPETTPVPFNGLLTPFWVPEFSPGEAEPFNSPSYLNT